MYWDKNICFDCIIVFGFFYMLEIDNKFSFRQVDSKFVEINCLLIEFFFLDEEYFMFYIL